MNYSSGSSTFKDVRPYSLFSHLFTAVGTTFNYSATIWNLARGLIGLLLAIGSGVGTMGNEVGDVGPWERFMIQVEQWGGRGGRGGGRGGGLVLLRKRLRQENGQEPKRRTAEVFSTNKGGKKAISDSLYLADCRSSHEHDHHEGGGKGGCLYGDGYRPPPTNNFTSESMRLWHARKT